MEASAFSSASFINFYGTIWWRNPLFSQIQLISISYFFYLDSSCVNVKLNYEKNLHFRNVKQSLFAGQFWKIDLLELSLNCLSTFSRSTAWVTIVYSWWLQHVKPESLVFWVRCDDLRWTEWTYCVVKSVCIQVKRQSVSESSSWNGNVEIFVEFIGLVSGVVHYVSTIGYFSAEDHTKTSVYVVDSSVGFLYE